ncbi:hypothetical protein SY27_09825 [Flavobacterium sp. 316]|uniref:hypothetical protein n=1 Tax=Flavobacterium sp. 316 TaxID=1603293 RepID=UPI0005DAC662|nr:hypothetical protein [Flavobacterium sp. 316]KIX21063.1 hypothetical protein SY27_09825 [Flavobacterium sp. 316]
MEEKNKKLKSIWGKWWESIRKWFYPVWLVYETSIRFYDYALGVYNYLEMYQDDILPYIGNIGVLTLAIFCSVVTFVVCTIFLTVPTCFVLYKFFKVGNLTGTSFEEKIKIYF